MLGTKAPWLLGGSIGNIRDLLAPDRTGLFHIAFAPGVLSVSNCRLRQFTRISNEVFGLEFSSCDSALHCTVLDVPVIAETPGLTLSVPFDAHHTLNYTRTRHCLTVFSTV